MVENRYERKPLTATLWSTDPQRYFVRPSTQYSREDAQSLVGIRAANIDGRYQRHYKAVFAMFLAFRASFVAMLEDAWTMQWLRIHWKTATFAAGCCHNVSPFDNTIHYRRRLDLDGHVCCQTFRVWTRAFIPSTSPSSTVNI